MHISILALCKVPASSKQNIFSDIKICCDLNDLSAQLIDETCLFSVDCLQFMLDDLNNLIASLTE